MGQRKQKASTGAGPEVAAPALSREAIESRAHEIFVARGAEPGHDLENWLQAERELLEEMQRSEASRARPFRAGRKASPRRRGPRSEV